MSLSVPDALDEALATGEPAILVTVTGTRGSTPRETGAAMLVTLQSQAGTIGGGALEWNATMHARRMLASGDVAERMDVPLGPEIGQCCGGRVSLSFVLADRPLLADLAAQERQRHEHDRHVLVFGAGHVGRALALALAPLPFRTILIDSRAETLEDLPAGLISRCSVLPEAEVGAAPAGAAFVVLTHSHALDFTVTEAALVRRDAAYVGMIGSKTKRAQFVRWCRGEGHGADLFAPLVMPIGGAAVKDKRPSVIAALVAAELTVKLLGPTSGRMSVSRWSETV